MDDVGERIMLDEVGFLRTQMQEDPELRQVILQICANRGHTDIGVFAFADWPAFSELVDGIHDLVDQS